MESFSCKRRNRSSSAGSGAIQVCCKIYRSCRLARKRLVQSRVNYRRGARVSESAESRIGCIYFLAPPDRSLLEMGEGSSTLSVPFKHNCDADARRVQMRWRLEVSTWPLHPIRFSRQPIGKRFEAPFGSCAAAVLAQPSWHSPSAVRVYRGSARQLNP